MTGRLELLAEGAIDDQILASRLAMRVLEQVSTELNELRLRIQHLEKRQELPRGDVLLPDVVCRILVDQWLDVQMSREGWALIQDAIAPVLAKSMLEAYKAANEFLVSSGVMKEIDLQALVKRAPGSRSPMGAGGGASSAKESAAAAAADGGPGGGGGGAGLDRRMEAPDGVTAASRAVRPAAWAAPAYGHSQPGRPSAVMGVHDETRLMTHSSPLARARMRAQGVVGRLRRLLADRSAAISRPRRFCPPRRACSRPWWR
jgi:hypothetical protein